VSGGVAAGATDDHPQRHLVLRLERPGCGTRPRTAWRSTEARPSFPAAVTESRGSRTATRILAARTSLVIPSNTGTVSPAKSTNSFSPTRASAASSPRCHDATRHRNRRTGCGRSHRDDGGGIPPTAMPASRPGGAVPLGFVPIPAAASIAANRLNLSNVRLIIVNVAGAGIDYKGLEGSQLRPAPVSPQGE
jgi:hypothetical protein